MNEETIAALVVIRDAWRSQEIGPSHRFPLIKAFARLDAFLEQHHESKFIPINDPLRAPKGNARV